MSILNYLNIFQMLTNAAVEFAVFNTTVIHYLDKGLLLFTCYSTDLELREVRLYTLGEHRQKLQENKSTW